MDSEEFRRWGHATIDWLVDYYEQLERLPVQSRLEPGDVRAKLPTHPPDQGQPFDRILADLDTIVVPGLTHWQAPGFHGFFPANSSPPSVLAELVSAGLGVQGMLWSTSPACTELETHMLDWLVELCGLPDRFLSAGSGGGVIQDSASSSTLCALLAARDRAGGAARLDDLRVYGSSQAHSSLLKGARVAGFSDDAVRSIEVDDQYAMRPDLLADALRADVAAGAVPCLVTATVGTTSSTAIDPVPAVAAVCADHGVWLHVDAAYAGSAAVCPELRFVNDGVERADSYTFNPHKWLLTNFDCSCLYVADRAALIDALSVTPEYLRNEATDSGQVIDYRDWQVPLGRRFRALKLWFVIRSYGAEGLRAHIRENVAWARSIAERVDAHDRLELVAPTRLGLVCFAHGDGDDATRSMLRMLNDRGDLLLTHTELGGRYTIRLAIGGARTEVRHVESAWEAISATADAVHRGEWGSNTHAGEATG